jgi:CubicO group peptidase (beta-lactamase class C family)
MLNAKEGNDQASFHFLAFSIWHLAFIVPPRVLDVDKHYADFDQPGVPGLAWMLVVGGKAVYARGYGLANLQTGVRCQPETNFRLASVTKQFTAMATLTLEDKLPRFFPDFPPCGKEITIRQLLTHTSGLLNYEDLIPPGTTVALKDGDVLEILRQQDKTHFPPGASFRYSNGGYALLALIVENVSGGGFADFLRDSIFLPLGMNNTVAYEEGISEVPHRAIGYSRKGAGFEQTDQSLTSAVLGDGGVYSSVLDLFKWDQAFYTEKLIGRPLLQQAFTAQAGASDAPGSGYGFGWYVEGQGRNERLWHHGSTCGFTTSFHRFPARNESLILLSNRSEAGLEAIVRKVMP